MPARGAYPFVSAGERSGQAWLNNTLLVQAHIFTTTYFTEYKSPQLFPISQGLYFLVPTFVQSWGLQRRYCSIPKTALCLHLSDGRGPLGVAQGDPEDPLKACCPGWEPRVSHVAWLDDAGSHLWAWGTFLGGCELRGMGLQVGLRGRQSGKARRLVHFPD